MNQVWYAHPRWINAPKHVNTVLIPVDTHFYMNMKNSYTGTCMCGSLRFSFTGSPRSVSECVCESCRRAHGASAVGWVTVKAEQFSLHDAQSCLSWFKSSAASERGFCSACGTRMLFRSDMWPGEIHMALACIDEPHDLVAAGVSFKAELPKWTVMKIS